MLQLLKCHGYTIVVTIVQIKCDLEDQTKFWSDLEDTERLLSLEKFMQIRSQTEVWSKNRV